MKRLPRRGDVYWVTLDPALGTEIRKTRPAVVIANDSCNAHGARVVVLPMTSNVTSLYPGEARIRVRLAWVLRDQIRSIDKARLRARIGSVSPAVQTRPPVCPSAPRSRLLLRSRQFRATTPQRTPSLNSSGDPSA